MSWSIFLLYLASAYAFYYAGNLCFDLVSTKPGAKPEEDKLVPIGISSRDIPQTVDLESLDPGFSEIDYFTGDGEGDIEDAPIVQSRGVSIKELFDLARSESIEYTHAVSF